jgi:hypothetical protein
MRVPSHTAHARTRSKRITTCANQQTRIWASPYFNKGIYFCLFIASASFCSPAYIIPPAIHAPTIIATPVNKVATSTVTSSPPSSYVTQRDMHYCLLIFRLTVARALSFLRKTVKIHFVGLFELDNPIFLLLVFI